ncbi:MAG: hypothetical protein HY675_22190 [Chloroflexi bacterium]|nr:hypothetical protein [Chloroflexota bacterium]
MRFLGSLGRLIKGSAAGVVAGLIVMALPMPEDIDPLWQMLQAPIGALLVVCSIGKALYDTLFYDRYRH